MIRSLYTAASGMVLGLRQQDVVADNIANSSTVGYKAEQSAQTAFGGVLARRIGPADGPVPGRVDEVIGQVGTGAFVENVRTYLGQGAERETGAPLDVMVRGDGFFVAQTDEGVRYTRDGHLDRDDQQRLITADGGRILDVDGNEIIIDTDRVRVKSDGTIHRLVETETVQPDGSTSVDVVEEFVAQLQVVTIGADDLVRAGDSKFVAVPGAALTPVDYAAGGTFILQGSLEEANVNIGQTATRLYSVARTYQSNQRVFAEINKTLESTVTELGRV
ncbi:MAG: flagellar hook-basal body protein [Dehalococcoidia bacterium]|nr:flagellar hook-basal body protein [Dehalococcoidia bacterium]